MKQPTITLRIYGRWYAYAQMPTLGAAKRVAADLRSRSFVAAITYLTPSEYATRRVIERILAATAALPQGGDRRRVRK